MKAATRTNASQRLGTTTGHTARHCRAYLHFVSSSQSTCWLVFFRKARVPSSAAYWLPRRLHVAACSCRPRANVARRPPLPSSPSSSYLGTRSKSIWSTRAERLVCSHLKVSLRSTRHTQALLFASDCCRCTNILLLYSMLRDGRLIQVLSELQHLGDGL